MSRPNASWIAKFGNAIRGISDAISSENSFKVHLPIAAAVLIAAIILQVPMIRILVLLVCIAGVLVSELFNTGIEALARAVTDRDDENIRTALDTAAGAVLIAGFFSGLVGLIVFGERLYELIVG